MVEAMEVTATVEVERSALDKLLLGNANVTYQFLRAMINRRRELETKVEQLVFKDVVPSWPNCSFAWVRNTGWSTSAASSWA